MPDLKRTIKDWMNLKNWRPYFIFLIIGFSLYGQTLFFDFTYFDDSTLILDNYPIISQIKNIGEIFSQDVFLGSARYYYRPILNLSFWGDSLLSGSNPIGFHLTNIFIHLLAVFLIFRLFNKLGYRRPLAFFWATLFLVHPVLTQAVAWIPGRNDSLLAVFVLAGILSFLSFKDRPRLVSYLIYLSFLLLALFTKETAVFLPAIIILYFLIVEPRSIRRSDCWLLVGGSLAVGVIWLVSRSLALGSEPVTGSLALSSILKNGPALLSVIGKTLLPFNLKVLPIMADSPIIYGLIILPLLALALFFSRPQNYRLVVFGAVWFGLFILPSFIKLNPVDTPDFLEHRLYLPLIGFLIVLAEIGWLKNIDFRRRLAWFLALTVLIFLAILTFRQAGNFQDRLTFWQAAVKGSPHSPLAHRNLGVMYYFSDNLAAAEKQYRTALALNENEPMVHNNLGVIYLKRRSWSQAEKEFKKELSLNPGYDKALFNLGEVYYQENRLVEAGELWTAVLKINPRYYEAYDRLNILEKRLR